MNRIAAARRQRKWAAQAARSDRGGEFANATLSARLRSEGIRPELTAPRAPQLNGAAERVSRSLLDQARCMIIQAGLGKALWPNGALCATAASNRLPRARLRRKSPLEIGHSRKPELDRLRALGCRALASAAGPKDKLADRAIEAAPLGFDVAAKGRRARMQKSGRVACSRDAAFDESKFPGIHAEDASAASNPRSSHSDLARSDGVASSREIASEEPIDAPGDLSNYRSARDHNARNGSSASANGDDLSEISNFR